MTDDHLVVRVRPAYLTESSLTRLEAVLTASTGLGRVILASGRRAWDLGVLVDVADPTLLRRIRESFGETAAACVYVRRPANEWANALVDAAVQSR